MFHFTLNGQNYTLFHHCYDSEFFSPNQLNSKKKKMITIMYFLKVNVDLNTNLKTGVLKMF